MQTASDANGSWPQQDAAEANIVRGYGLAGRTRSVVRAGAMVALTSVMLPGSQLHVALRDDALAKRAAFRAWERRWAEQLLKLFGMRLSMVGAAPKRPAARLIVANHRSPVDILVAIARVGGCVLSRADLATWPLLGQAAQAAGTIFVDRDDRKSGASAIRQIRNRLKAGEHVVVFPEGATFEGDEVRPFQAGAFTAARGLPIEVVPVGIAYPAGCEFVNEGFAEHMMRVSMRPFTRVGIAVGEAYPLAGSRDEAALRAQQCVQDLVHQARSACGD